LSTALELIEDAFEELKVKSTGIPLASDHIAKGIRAMNLIMAREAVFNRSLGYTTVSASSDAVTIPDWAEDHLVAAMAIQLGPKFGKDISAMTIERYRNGRAAVLEMTVSADPVLHWPETMPVGAGNECNGAFDIRTLGDSVGGHFFGNEIGDDLKDGNGELLRDEQGRVLED